MLRQREEEGGASPREARRRREDAAAAAPPAIRRDLLLAARSRLDAARDRNRHDYNMLQSSRSMLSHAAIGLRAAAREAARASSLLAAARRGAAPPPSSGNGGGTVLLDGAGDLFRGQQQRRRPLVAENGQCSGENARKPGKVSLSPLFSSGGGSGGSGGSGSGGAIAYGAKSTISAPPAGSGGGRIVHSAAAAPHPVSGRNTTAPGANSVVTDFKGDLSKEGGLLVKGCGIAEVNGIYHVSGKVAYGCHVYAKQGAWKRQSDVTYVIHHGTAAASNEWRLGVWQSGTLDGFDGSCLDRYRLYKSADGGRTWTKLYNALDPCPTVTAAPAAGTARSEGAAAGTESTDTAAESERTGDGSEIEEASESASDDAMEDDDEGKDEEEEDGESSDEADLQDEDDVETEAPGTDETKPIDGEDLEDDDDLLPPLADSAMNDLLDQYLTDEFSGGEDCGSDVESSRFPAEELTVRGCGLEGANGPYGRSGGTAGGGPTFARRTEGGGAFELYSERRGGSRYLFLARASGDGERGDLYFAEGGLSAISFAVWSVIADAGDVGPAPSAVEVGAG